LSRLIIKLFMVLAYRYIIFIQPQEYIMTYGKT